MHALLAMLQHGAGDIRIYPAVDDVEQRMQGTIGVPNGKDRVVREIVRLVDIMKMCIRDRYKTFPLSSGR